MKVNKTDAVEIFRAEVLPYLRWRDETALNEAWNNWTDMLCKDGEITDWQYNNWTGPKWTRKDRGE